MLTHLIIDNKFLLADWRFITKYLVLEMYLRLLISVCFTLHFGVFVFFCDYVLCLMDILNASYIFYFFVNIVNKSPSSGQRFLTKINWRNGSMTANRCLFKTRIYWWMCLVFVLLYYLYFSAKQKTNLTFIRLFRSYV